MEVIHRFSDVVCQAYFIPRLALDGEAACRGPLAASELQQRAERFFELVCAACLREDAAVRAFGMMLDTPNLHRLRELVDHVLPAPRHLRHSQELLLEIAHQPLKRAVLSGNGRADASRAMQRYAHEELAARIRRDSAYFHIAASWREHAGVPACHSHVRYLWSMADSESRCTTGALPEASLHPIVVRIGQARFDPACRIRWRCRASRSSTLRMQIHDAVSVRVSGEHSYSAVSVARGSSRGATIFFKVWAFFTTRAGTASAVVHPFTPLGDHRYRDDQDSLL